MNPRGATRLSYAQPLPCIAYESKPTSCTHHPYTSRSLYSDMHSVLQSFASRSCSVTRVSALAKSSLSVFSGLIVAVGVLFDRSALMFSIVEKMIGVTGCGAFGSPGFRCSSQCLPWYSFSFLSMRSRSMTYLLSKCLNSAYSAPPSSLRASLLVSNRLSLMTCIGSYLS